MIIVKVGALSRMVWAKAAALMTVDCLCCHQSNSIL